MRREARAAVVLAKAPAPGRGKARIAEVLGPAAALRLATAMLEDTLGVVRAMRVEHRMLCLDGAWPEVAGFARAAQPDGDLGLRQADALARGLVLAPRVVVLGTDAEALGPETLERALDGLDAADGCVVPAMDGGFVALAVRGLPSGLLDGLPWSRPDTCAALRARYAARRLVLAEVGLEADVDTVDDLARVAASARAAPVRPRLAACARDLVRTTG